MSELALASVPASSLLFPATAEFRFVETQLSIVGTRTITIRGGVLGDGRGRGSQSAVVICGGTSICARVLTLELPGHQLRSSEIVLCVGLWWVELVGEHGKSGSTKGGGRIHARRELLLEVIGQKLLQRGGFTERSGVGSRVLVSRTEGLSLYSGNSRILGLWHNHIVQLLSVSSGEGLNRVCEISRAGHDILNLLIKAASGLGLTERDTTTANWTIIHPGLSKGVPGELSLGNVVVDLEILLVAGREGGEGGLIAVRPILVGGVTGQSNLNVISGEGRNRPGRWSREAPCRLMRQRKIRASALEERGSGRTGTNRNWYSKRSPADCPRGRESPSCAFLGANLRQRS